MTRHRTPDGELDLGDLVTAAMGLDRSWVKDAACRRWVGDDPEPRPTPWTVSKADVVNGARGTEMIKVALMICHTCSAQYDCARYAVNGQMRAGTWSMGITQLRWLQDQEDRDEIIDAAEDCAAPMHAFVASLRDDDALVVTVSVG